MLKTMILTMLIACGLMINSAQAIAGATNEVVTFFADGSIHFPTGQTTASVSDVGFVPPEIRDTLLYYSADVMTKVFPNHDPADSIVQSPIHPGLAAKRMVLHRVFRISLTNPETGIGVPRWWEQASIWSN